LASKGVGWEMEGEGVKKGMGEGGTNDPNIVCTYKQNKN
jgi:hypothetical protein